MNIPSKANKHVGNNGRGRTTRRSTRRGRPSTRRSTRRPAWPRRDGGQDALADYVASIPLYQSPTLFIYDHDRLGGNLQDNTTMGPFFTMNEWTLK